MFQQTQLFVDRFVQVNRSESVETHSIDWRLPTASNRPIAPKVSKSRLATAFGSKPPKVSRKIYPVEIN
jgi:hypothetical protein